MITILLKLIQFLWLIWIYLQEEIFQRRFDLDVYHHLAQINDMCYEHTD